MFGNKIMKSAKNIMATENNVPGGTSGTILENLDIKLEQKLDCFIVNAGSNDHERIFFTKQRSYEKNKKFVSKIQK